MRLRQHNLDLGLAVGDQHNPAEALPCDLVAYGQTKRVAVEAECGVWIVDKDVHTAK